MKRLIEKLLSRLSPPSLPKMDVDTVRESARHAEGKPGLVTYGGVWTKFNR